MSHGMLPNCALPVDRSLALNQKRQSDHEAVQVASALPYVAGRPKLCVTHLTEM